MLIRGGRNNWIINGLIKALMVQLFVIILSVRRIYVEECARTVGVAYRVSSTNFLPLIE